MNFIINETHSAISIRSVNLLVSWLIGPKIKQVLLQNRQRTIKFKPHNQA